MEKNLILEQFAKDMQIRNFSGETIKLYNSQLRLFIDYCKEVPQTVDVVQIRDYLLYLKTIRHYSASSLNVAYSVLKIYFIRIIEQQWPYQELGRAKLEYKLPQIFTQQEIGRLLTNISNLKHKAVLTLMYSAGLRIGELIALTPIDIDSKQMYVVVRGGKGKKDRTTLLSPKCLELLREYYLVYRPKKYLFNGFKKESPYSQTSIINILKKASKKADIKKNFAPQPSSQFCHPFIGKWSQSFLH